MTICKYQKKIKGKIIKCDKNASFGKASDWKAIRCVSHKTKKLVYVKARRCSGNKKCTKRANYCNTEKTIFYCFDHKPDSDDYRYNSHDRCKFEDCKNPRRYGKKNGPVLYCVGHKLEGHVISKKTCVVGECLEKAKFNYEGKNSKYCEDHSKKGMVRTYRKELCEVCNKLAASFGLPGNKPSRCSNHIEKNMINVTKKLCDVKDCTEYASFGFSGLSPTKCKEHSLPGQRLRHPYCTYPKCDTLASFAKPGEKPIHCFKHKDKDEINVLSPKCNVCGKVATFGILGKNPFKCSAHADKHHIYMLKRRCEFCNITPSFGYVAKKPLRCKIHKTEEMIPSFVTKCQLCDKRATHGYDKYVRCVTHAENKMIRLGVKKCSSSVNEKQCSYVALFGPLNGKKERCFAHKLTTDEPLYRQKCELCSTKIRFGYPGKKATRCSAHKLPNQIRNPTKKCIEKPCKEIALYGETFIQNHCETHKKKGEINLIEKICVKCSLQFIVNAPISFRLFKQKQVKEILDNKEYPYKSYDKVVNSLGKERPDFLFECKGYNVILEVDEFQHRAEDYKPKTENTKINERKEFNKVNATVDNDKYMDFVEYVTETKDSMDFYDFCHIGDNNDIDDEYLDDEEDYFQSYVNDTCENKRMKNIVNSLQTKVIFIRYNPDPFKVKGEKQNPSKNSRFTTLCKVLDCALNKNIKELGWLQVVHLYYDEFEVGKKIKFDEIKMF